MKLLLDTCAILWWWAEPDRLSKRSIALISDPSNRIEVSAASAWEVATKYRIGKFPGATTILRDWIDRLPAVISPDPALSGLGAEIVW
jgi:PIN domain nuclease of toxin-antitoxin system